MRTPSRGLSFLCESCIFLSLFRKANSPIPSASIGLVHYAPHVFVFALVSVVACLSQSPSTPDIPAPSPVNPSAASFVSVQELSMSA
jgi:hypothetical protein